VAAEESSGDASSRDCYATNAIVRWRRARTSGFATNALAPSAAARLRASYVRLIEPGGRAEREGNPSRC
jgi:hypothetical protein